MFTRQKTQIQIIPIIIFNIMFSLFYKKIQKKRLYLLTLEKEGGVAITKDKLKNSAPTELWDDFPTFQTGQSSLSLSSHGVTQYSIVPKPISFIFSLLLLIPSHPRLLSLRENKTKKQTKKPSLICLPSKLQWGFIWWLLPNSSSYPAPTAAVPWSPTLSGPSWSSSLTASDSFTELTRMWSMHRGSSSSSCVRSHLILSRMIPAAATAPDWREPSG